MGIRCVLGAYRVDEAERFPGEGSARTRGLSFMRHEVLVPLQMDALCSLGSISVLRSARVKRVG